MKRKTLKSIACAAIMALTLSVTACGGSDDTAPSAETEAADDAAGTESDTETETDDADAATDDAAETETEDDGADDTAAATGETVESLLNDPATKAQYEEEFAEYEEQGMSVEVEAKGNELLMSLTIQDSSLITDDAAAQLQSALDQSEAIFGALAGALDTSVGAESGTCTYSVRYLDPDGNVLAEKSFKAE